MVRKIKISIEKDKSTTELNHVKNPDASKRRQKNES